jgi:hypothetical protein
MICGPCGRAADQQAPRTAHCTDPGCTCGHRVERYGTVTAKPSTATTKEN